MSMLYKNDQFNNSKLCHPYYHKIYLPHHKNLKQDNRNISLSNQLSSSSSLNVPVQVERNLANADSGTTGNYIAFKNKTCMQKLMATNDHTKISVEVANGQSIKSSHIGELVVPGGDTVTAYLFPEINGSLLSISVFVDIGYTVIYSKTKVSFMKNNFIVFEGQRDSNSGL